MTEKLKTATILATVGIVLHMVWSLVRWRRAPALPEGMTFYFRFSMIPPLCFHLGLIAFFVALYRKQ